MKTLPLIFRPSLVVKRILRSVGGGLPLQTRLTWICCAAVLRLRQASGGAAGKTARVSSMSVIELGVAADGTGGAGEYRRRDRRAVGIDIQVYGFDSGGGLPPPADNRDLPYVWQKDFTASTKRPSAQAETRQARARTDGPNG